MKLKKTLAWIGGAVFIAAAAALAASIFFLGKIVKREVEEMGPRVTQVNVLLDSADVVLFPGRIGLRGLFIGNPPNYKTGFAVKVDNVSVHFNAMSALSDKVIISSINVKSPEITLEGGLKDNNLSKLQKNVTEYINGPGNAPAVGGTAESKAGKKLQIDDFVITGTKLHLAITGPFSLHENTTLTLPDIHLSGLGAGPEGITSAEVTQKALNALLNSALNAAANEVAKLGGDTFSKVKAATKGVDFKKAGERLKGLFGQ